MTIIGFAAMLQEANERLQVEFEQAMADNSRKCAEIQRLRTVLKAVEWISDHDDMRWCPSCSCLWPEHASGCQLKAALDAAGGAE